MDAALVLECITGLDPLDPTSVTRRREDFCVAPKRKRLRLGRPREHFLVKMDPEVRRITEAALADFVKRSGTLENISLPSIVEGIEAANLIAGVEATRVHERAGYFPARAGEYGMDVRGRLEQGGRTRAADYLSARETMRRAREGFEAALKNVDAIVIPTGLVAAPPMGRERVRVDDVEMLIRGAFVDINRAANFTGLPAISIPCGFTKNGLPVAVQFIGRRFEETMLIGIARRFSEGRHDWQTRRPPLD
jgi:aspartyl-tRNA(Asn)/glutamyl-tRNA(Gln) amidotransferase subunit A